MRKKVILVSGKINSGKNVFAGYLENILKKKRKSVKQDLFAYNVKNGAKNDFQDLVKQIDTIKENLKIHTTVIEKNAKAYGVYSPTEPLRKEIEKLSISDDNWFEDKTNITRSLLQIYGTDIFRKRVDDLYWIKDTKKRILESKAKYIIITDVRFPNEIENMYHEDYDIVSIRINRKVNTDKNIAEHISECALDKYKNFSYKINNNESLEDLEICAQTLIKDINKKV